MKCRIRSGPVKAFQKWVTHEVLPEIRKNQVYFKPEIIEDVINNPGTSVDYIERLKKENRNKDIIIEDLQEAKRFFDAATASTACCSVGTVAKHLSQRGYSIGAVRLFRWLRLNNFLSVQKHSYNVPLQWAIERGLFEVDMQNLIQYTTEDALAHVPMVTPKGQAYIINKFIKDAETKKYRVLEHGLDDEFRRDVNGFIHLTPKKGGRFEDFCKHRDLNK